METFASYQLKRRSAYLALTTIILLGVGSGVASSEDLKIEQPIPMAISNEPPYMELKSDGTLTGLGPDVDRAVLAQVGVTKFDAQPMAYGAMIPALQAGRVKMVSAGGLAIRPERCKQVIFSEPVLCTSDAFLTRQDSKKYITYKEAAELNVKIAVPAGSIQERNALTAGVKRENLVSYPDGTSAVKMLQDKRVDAVALNDSAVIEMKKRSGDDTLQTAFPITDAPLACGGAAFNKNDTALRDAYNTGLKKVIESGEYAKIVAKYGLEHNGKLLTMAKPTAELCAQ